MTFFSSSTPCGPAVTASRLRWRSRGWFSRPPPIPSAEVPFQSTVWRWMMRRWYGTLALPGTWRMWGEIGKNKLTRESVETSCLYSVQPPMQTSTKSGVWSEPPQAVPLINQSSRRIGKISMLNTLTRIACFTSYKIDTGNWPIMFPFPGVEMSLSYQFWASIEKVICSPTK